MEDPRVHQNPSRTPLHPAIDEAMIETLVRAFYGKVRRDPDLGPIFAGVVGDDWEPHLQKMFAFWSSVTLRSGRYSGRPVPAHFKLEGLEPRHFARWLTLFRETAAEICGDEVAAVFVERAEKIAQSLQLALFYKPGLSPAFGAAAPRS